MLVLALFVFSALCIQSVRSDTIIDRVHVVFSCHLDVGYAALIADIVNEWFDLYFPQAIATANAMRAGGGEDRFKFMTHSWLVSMYLDCPVGLGFHCPNASAVNDFVAAVKRGDIYWHAYGFNSEPEGYPDSSLFEFGVQLTHALDEKFSLKRKTTLSQRDVPGMTRGVIPILAKHGVNAISIGVNGGCAPPAVPKIFKWKDNATQAWVYGLVHAGGYGGISVSDCATAPGFRSALAYAWRTDNSGPQSVSEVESIYEQIRKEFPGAQVFASSFDTFVDELAAADALGTVDLEVVTKEMGDTWIYGYASDPKKMASLRAFSAMRDKCLHEGWCVLDDPRIFNSSRFLLKLSEHTWGYYAITGDGNPPYWSNEEFELHRNASGFQVAAQSYVEQAQYVDWALQALGNHPLAAVVETELLNLVPTRPLLGGLQSIPAEKFGRDLQCGSSITLALDSNTGAIVKLIANGVSLATSSNRIAQLVYSTYDERDFDWYLKEYAYNGKVEQSAFTKPELETAHPSPVSKTWFPILLDLWWSNSTSVGCRMVQKLQFGHFPSSVYGAPKEVWMEVDMDSVSVSVCLFSHPTATTPSSNISPVFRARL